MLQRTNRSIMWVTRFEPRERIIDVSLAKMGVGSSNLLAPAAADEGGH